MNVAFFCWTSLAASAAGTYDADASLYRGKSICVLSAKFSSTSLPSMRNIAPALLRQVLGFLFAKPRRLQVRSSRKTYKGYAVSTLSSIFRHGQSPACAHFRNSAKTQRNTTKHTAEARAPTFCTSFSAERAAVDVQYSPNATSPHCLA